MVRNALTLLDNFNQLTPYAVGFDRVFDTLNRYVDNNVNSTGFPPYNIRKEGEYNYVIEMALAGFGKKDIEVEVADGTLSVRSVKENSDDPQYDIEKCFSYQWTESDFIYITKKLKSVANRFCEDRVVSCLEGGYHLEKLTTCCVSHIKTLME